MAFVFNQARGHALQGEGCFAGQFSSGGSCRAFARACAGPCQGSAQVTSSFGANVGRELELTETPESFLIYFDAQGFRRDDIRVRIRGSRVEIRASRQEDHSTAVIEKSWPLPKDVVQDGIHAKFEEKNSELTVVLPKEPKAAVEVPIEVNGGSTTQANAAAEPSPTQAGGTDADYVDGSWVEVADEDIARAKAKGKAPMTDSVLQEAHSAQPGSSSDSD